MSRPLAAVSSGFPALLIAMAVCSAVSLAQEAKPDPKAAKEAAPIKMDGLPTFLLPVPGGATTIGMTAEQLMRAVLESINPTKPEQARAAPDKVVRALKNTASELGQNKEQVDTFLLGKWPVKNSEYEVFVKKLRDQKQKVRPPFHWWQTGMKDDFEKHREDILKEFKADGKYGPKLYWERHGDELPFALVDEFGKSIADKPVVFITYRDAIRFAGWLGMRLPTELERTRAVRGDSAIVWPWGNNKELGDAWSEKALAALKLTNMKDRVLKPVGTVEGAHGPFGHWDMTGQVWEFTSRLGFGPIGERAKWETEWKLLMKDKVAAQMQNPPAWKDGLVIVKGGSYYTATTSDWIQFHIDCRDKVETNDALDVIGLRLAKSLKPGYDILVSWIQAGYDQSLFASDQSVDYKGQVGVERYVLAANGFPEEYHAFSFAPLNALTTEKNAALNKFEEKSLLAPIAIGTIAVTEKVLSPALPANSLYTIAFRNKGIPKELEEALKVGVKAVAAAKKNGDVKDEGGDDKKKGNDWRAVIAKFGLTDKDLESGAPAFVRLNGYEVPYDTAVFLFMDNTGKYVAHLATKDGLTAGNAVPSELVFDARKGQDQERAHVGLKACLPLQAGQKRGVSFTLDFTLDCAPPSATEVWRLP